MSSGGNKVFPHYSGIEYSKEFEDKRLTIKLEDIDNQNHPTIMVSEHERTYIYPGHVDTVSSDNQTFTEMDFNEFRISRDGGINRTTFRQGGIDYNNIYFNLNSNKQELESYTIATLDDIPSLDGYATQTWVENKGYATSSSLATVATTGSYNDLTDKPSIPSTATSTSTSTVTPTTIELVFTYEDNTTQTITLMTGATVSTSTTTTLS